MEQAKDLKQQWLKIATLDDHRHELIDGEPCPLCGALDHPYATNLPFKIGENEILINNLTIELQTVEKLLQGIKTSATTIATTNLNIKARIQENLSKIKAIREALIQNTMSSNEISKDIERIKIELETCKHELVVRQDKDLIGELMTTVEELKVITTSYLNIKGMRMGLYQGNDINGDADKIQNEVPLFTAPSAKLTQRLSVPALLVDEGPAQVAVDEHREIAQVFTSGAIQFFDLASGQPIPLEMPAQVTSRQITAMASGGGNAPRLAVGTADGEVLFLKVGTTTEFTDRGERRKRPHIRAGQPIPLTKGPIVRLAYRANDHGSLLALLSKGGRLLVVRIAADDVAGDHPIITELPQPKGVVTALALDALLENLYVGTAEGQVVHVALSEHM